MSKIKDTQTNQIVNKGKGAILKVFARLATTGLISFGIGGAITFESYNNYWDKTIFRVQTVDFNILSHTLPTKLSYALIKEQPEEVQRTLDSNYHHFGLIVTDTSGQKIIAYSGKGSDKPLSWKAALDPQQLKNHSYDVLLNPPPLFPQWTYAHPYATERSATDFTNQGRIIGRVYYVRGVRPTLQKDVMKLLKNPFSESSRIQTYSTSLLGTFFIWGILEFILYRKRVESKKAQEKEEELINNNQILQVQLAERINELQLFQKQRDNERNEFEKEANDLRISNEKLETEIVTLTNSIKILSANTNSIQLQNELQEAQEQSQQNLKQKQQYENHIKQHENHIKQLTQKLQVIHNQQVEASQQNEQKNNELQELQQQINEIEDARNLAKSQLESLQKKEETYQKIVESLQEKISQQNSREQELTMQLKRLEGSLSEYKKREKLLENLANQAKAESEALTIEIAIVKEDLPGKHPLNDFETTILNSLEEKFQGKRVFVQFDVANGNTGSMCTDFVIAMNNCCIVIEAKYYTGKIQSIGYVRNTGWVCITNTQTKNIRACWGKNPYEQVWTYSVSLYGRIRSFNRNKLPVYGIVVFPTGSVIDDRIQSNISNFYRVTTLDDLEIAIQELENLARFRNRTRLTYEQILQKLTGISDQEAA